MRMKRQKIKRYRFRVTQDARRKTSAAPQKAVGVILVCFGLIAGLAFGGSKAAQSKAAGWQGEGLHRCFVSPTTGIRVQGLYEIDQELYYFGSSSFVKVGWINESGYVGYADQDGKIAQGEAVIDGKSYYFQPGTGQLYTGWVTLDGVEYCFDETGHPRTGIYQENGISWELDAEGRVKRCLSGWNEVDGIQKYYDETGAPAQGWIKLDEKDYFFVDGISQPGWAETDAGIRYLDGSGNQMTGWCVIDGQPTAFDAVGVLKQGWEHSHEKNYYFVDGISQAGTFQEGQVSRDLNGSGSIQPAETVMIEEDLAEDAEGEGLDEERVQIETEPQQAEPALEQPATDSEEPETAAPEAAAEPTVPAQDRPEEREENT